ncbi:hypothetical protein PORY_000686 [Pneumocystis oryctolagi]|uniref:Uncharacterized protein n=1 Tax=Pneumocystis oryctolagi TaxID=42067 RepID=A0ACB7CDD4_9ASCO|nr:hypothetical protein PORY_000686 [Pneumocystis oryctolagi]
MFKFNIKSNTACQFSSLRVPCQKIYSRQNLRIYSNEFLRSDYTSLVNSDKCKFSLKHNYFSKTNILSVKSLKFSNLSSENENIKKQIIKEDSLESSKKTSNSSRILKNNVLHVSNSSESKHNMLKTLNYKQKNVQNKNLPKVLNKTQKHFSKTRIVKTTDKDIFIKKKNNLKKQNATQSKPNTSVPLNKKSIVIPQAITISNLSQLLGLKFIKLSKKMKELGFTNLNYDFLLTSEEASLIAMEYNYDPVVSKKESFDLYRQKNKEKMNFSSRIPVVTIMGHVDHGKTTLLDFLRKSSIALHEEGGITQHIRAFSVTTSYGEKICFLDTPGHSAFESMRKRGTIIADIVVLVVAADDGVMPQTIEAINHIKKAGVPIIVAINKIDKEGVNIQNVKLDLLKNGVELEEFGGDTQVVLISAITGQGVKDLEYAILTLAEILDIKSEVDGNVEGWIIESLTKKTKGHLATILVKEGTLRLGSYIVSGTTWCRVRSMIDTFNKSVDSASPGTVVEVSGWKDIPFVGDDVLEATNEEQAKKVVKNRLIRLEKERQMNNIDVINKKRLEHYQKELKTIENDFVQKEPKEVLFIIKADVNGSAQAIQDALTQIGNNEIKIKVIFSSVGSVTESDIGRASAAHGYIISFNLKLNKKIAQLAYREKVKILSHSVIYKLLDHVKEELTELLPLKVKYNIIGEAKILKVFILSRKTSKISIAGCIIINGIVSKNDKVRVLRDQKIIWEGKLESLRHIKKEMAQMKEGEECGMSFGEWNGFLEGDLIQTYKEEYVKQKL